MDEHPRCDKCKEHLQMGPKGEASIGACIDCNLELCRACFIDHNVEEHGDDRKELEELMPE